jgi:hypothetical protein
VLTLDDRKTAGGEAPRESGALSRDYTDFLVDLSIGLHKYGMYPSEHPSLQPAAKAVVTRAAPLLETRAQIAFGVARRQLIIEGVATNPAQLVLRRLAEGLHRHHLGAVTVLRGVTPEEVGQALRALSREPEQQGPLGLAPDAQRSWAHVRLHPLSFGGLALVADAPLSPDRAGSQAGDTRGVELWIGLARAAMAGESEDTPPDTEPTVVARAIDEHPRVEAYDQVVIGYLLQIARELRTSSGPEVAALQRRTARLISALNPDTLRRLVEMSGDLSQRKQFVLDAAHGMAVDTVIDIVKAAANASGQPISDGLVRMLSKLAAHAELGSDQARPAADNALREQVGQLLNGWELADPNPDEYGKLLQHLATTSAGPKADGGGTSLQHRPEPVRLVQISLESGDTGPMIEKAIDQAIARHEVPALVRMAVPATNHGCDAGRALTTQLARPDTLRALLEQPTVDFETLDRLLPIASPECCGVLLDALAASHDRATRRKLLDRLAAFPHDLERALSARLQDDRWYVLRNMLVLFERRRTLPDPAALAHAAAHEDIRVRQEAIRLQLRIPEEHDAAVRSALDSGHVGLAHAGLAALQQECPAHLVDRVGAIAADPRGDETLRVLAARALGRCADRRALAALLALTDGGRTLLGRARLAARTPVMLAALEALSAGWCADARAAALVKLAAASPDHDIRRAATQGVS